MDNVISNQYLGQHLISFFDIHTMICLTITTKMCRSLVVNSLRYRKLTQCLPLCDIEIRKSTNRICQFGNAEVLDWYLTRFSIYKLDDILIDSARYGNLGILEYLFQKYPGSNKELALEWAIRGGYIDVVKYLVLLKVDIHHKDDQAFRWSIRFKHFEIAKYLVEIGANIHADKNYALRTVIFDDNNDMIDFLTSHGGKV
jgi:ankyrin repeat protein